MPLFVTEHRLSGLTPSNVESLTKALDEAGRRLTEADNRIHLVHSHCTADSHLVCTFAASSEALVLRALAVCQLPLPLRCELTDPTDLPEGLDDTGDGRGGQHCRREGS